MFNSEDDDSENDADYEPPADELEDEDEEAENSDCETPISEKKECIPDKVYKEKVWENFLADSKSDSSSASKTSVKIAESNTSKQTTDEKPESNKIVIESTKPIEETSKPQATSTDLPKVGRGIKRHSTLDSVIGKINKKTKVTTLQKSIDDWNNFKREEGIEDTLRTYNKGKGGFIQKQQFLLKSDLASFEKERELRLSKK